VDIRVTVDPGLPKVLTEPVVAWGAFEGTCAGLAVYSRGSGASALSRLDVDLICGRPLPLTFVTREVRDLETVVAMSLFLDRSLCLHPLASTLVSAVELATHLQEGGLAHVERDLARLLVFLEGYVAAPVMNRAEEGRKVQQVVTWLRAYAEEGTLPSFSRAQEPPTVLDRGTNGFVLATTSGGLVDSVVELYRAGHLRGIVFSTLGNGLERALAFKKSPYVRFDLQAAEHHLNAVEASLGQPGRWKLDRFLLAGPVKGTHIPRADLIQTFLRV
jgi:hypothetical protein